MNHPFFFHSDDEVFAIARGLEHCTLPKSARTHAAHFGAVLFLLTRHSEGDVSQRMPGMIRAYNESLRTPNSDTRGYHETITQASIRAASHFLKGAPVQPLFVTCNNLMASPLGDSNWLLEYWSRDRLFSI